MRLRYTPTERWKIFRPTLLISFIALLLRNVFKTRNSNTLCSTNASLLRETFIKNTFNQPFRESKWFVCSSITSHNSHEEKRKKQRFILKEKRTWFNLRYKLKGNEFATVWKFLETKFPRFVEKSKKIRLACLTREHLCTHRCVYTS